MSEVILDALKDTILLIPILFLTYLFLESVEGHLSGKMTRLVGTTRWFDPIVGAIVGIVPECGFSAAAASLFSAGTLTVGTLVAVFLATSDEMLPILISEQVPFGTIAKILGTKVVVAAIAGLILNMVFVRRNHEMREDNEERIEELCEHSHCSCGEHHGIVKPALIHTGEIVLFVLIVNLVLNMVIHFGGADLLQQVSMENPVLSCFVAALVGLIPNCAVSVALTELYLNGMLGTSAMLAGLLSGSGVGLLVLFRTNRHIKENLLILAIVYVCGAFGGLLAGLVF